MRYTIASVVTPAASASGASNNHGVKNSPSALGTVLAQYHLRQSCVYLNMHLLNMPEVMIAAAHTKFDDKGTLVDETTRGFIRDLLTNLAAWTRRIQRH